MPLKVRDVMNRRAVEIERDSTLRDCAALMERRRIGSVILTNRGSPTGILTEGDVSRAVGRGVRLSMKASSLKGESLLTISPEASLEEAARIMAEKRIKKLPVVDESKLVGMLTQTDIVASVYSLVSSLKEPIVRRSKLD